MNHWPPLHKPKGCTKRDNSAKPSPNKLAGRKKRIQPGHLFVSDITLLSVGEGFMYMAAFMDFASRYLVSWRLSNTQKSDLCCDALTDALALHSAPQMVHRDQGGQYTSENFRKLLATNRISQSMTGSGGWMDNAEMESFFKTLKQRCSHIRSWADALEAERDLHEFIFYYNHRRPHSALGMKTPASVFRPALAPQSLPDFPAAVLSALGFQQLGLASS